MVSLSAVTGAEELRHRVDANMLDRNLGEVEKFPLLCIIGDHQLVPCIFGPVPACLVYSFILCLLKRSYI